MSNIRNLLEKMDQFAGQAVGQKPGDQVHGTEKATKKKSGEHPFAGRLVGASESAGSLLRELQLELDKPEATVRRDLFREFAEYRQGVTEEDAWHSSEDAPQDAWHSATAESEGDAEGLPHLTTKLIHHILQQMKTQGPQVISKSIEWGDGAATELTELIRHALEDYLDHAELDEEISAPMTPGVAPTAPAANTAANPAAMAQMKSQQLKTLAAQKKSTQDQIKQTQEQLDALRKQLASLSNPANVAMPSITGTV